MARDNFSEVSINPNSRLAPEESNAPRVAAGLPAGVNIKLLAGVAAAALLLGGVLSYSRYQLSRHQTVQGQAFQNQLGTISRSLDVIGQRLDKSGDQAAALESRLSVTMDRVGVTQRDLANARALAQRLRQEQARNLDALNRELAHKANTEQVASLQSDAGQKFNAVNREITDVKDKVQSNRQELTALGVRITEQGNMIATNSTGLAELRLRGERDYVTIDLRKKQRVQVAGIALELKKAELKKHRADLRIYANDIEVDKEDIDVNTPIYFYVGAESLQYELVINEVNKDRITGYISTPKGKMPQGRRALRSSSP
jgi:hypothetical protein